MNNKKIMKEVFNNKFEKENLKKEILAQEQKRIGFFQYAFILLLLIIPIFFNYHKEGTNGISNEEIPFLNVYFLKENKKINLYSTNEINILTNNRDINQKLYFDINNLTKLRVEIKSEQEKITKELTSSSYLEIALNEEIIIHLYGYQEEKVFEQEIILKRLHDTVYDIEIIDYEKEE